MTATLNNPFVVYGYEGPEYFCDREAEAETIIEGLHNERNIALLAPRRLGKSGLIHHIFNQLAEQEPDTVCVYIDIMNTKSLRQFIEVFASHTIGALDNSVQAAMRHASNFFRGLRPTVSFDNMNGNPQFSLTFEDSQQQQTLENIFDYIRQQGKRCYIAFDEFQQITTYKETGTEALLRSYIQFLPNTRFIFAGSEQHLLANMFMSAKQPFYLAAQMVTLKEIDEQKYHAFANNFFRKQGREITKNTFERLYNLVDGQTWFVQCILNRLYANGAELNDADVDRAVNQLVGELTVGFENYYASLTSNQAALITAIAKEGRVKEPLAHSFIKRHQLAAPSSVRQALKALEKQQFVYSSPDGYLVYDRFFGLWLRNL